MNEHFERHDKSGLIGSCDVIRCDRLPRSPSFCVKDLWCFKTRVEAVTMGLKALQLKESSITKQAGNAWMKGMEWNIQPLYELPFISPQVLCKLQGRLCSMYTSYLCCQAVQFWKEAQRFTVEQRWQNGIHKHTVYLMLMWSWLT